MIVVTMTDCPPALRGDLSKWLMEINTGVYVGQVSARVRDKLWERITTHIKSGRATMVFDAANEQKMDFRIHNTAWEIVDCDGLKLVRRPSEQRVRERNAEDDLMRWETGFSNAAQQRKLSRIMKRKDQRQRIDNTPKDYTVVDIETTGLDAGSASIIEMGALRVRDHQISETFNVLVNVLQPIPKEVSELTGLTNDSLAEGGIPLIEALQRLIQFIGEDMLVIHNASFDLGFIRQACLKYGLSPIANRSMDTCALARKALLQVPDYKLSTLARHFGIVQKEQHRALADCQTALRVYQSIVQTE